MAHPRAAASDQVPRGRWVLAAAILGSSLVFIDGTMVNVALSALETDLHATVVGVAWVVEAYALFLSALLLVGGALGDFYGRRKVFALGMLLFAGGSACCGLSPDLTTLVAARAVQGVGGALLTPGSLALISATFPEHERGRAIGTWSGASGVAAAIGPVLGGWFIDRFSWRWAFFINLPLSVIALAILFARVPESRNEERRGRLDLWGAALVTLGLFGLVFGLLESSRLGLLAPRVLLGLVGGALTLLAFVLVEARRKAPMLPLALFRSRAFAGTNLLTLLLYGALSGALFFLPMNLIQLQGYGATEAGAAFLPFVAIVFVLSRWAGGLVERYGARRPLMIGPSIAACGFATLACPGLGGSYWLTYFPGVSVLGLGMAVTIAPLTTTVMNAVDERRAGLASGVNNAVSRTAGLIAVAALGIVFYRVFANSLDDALSAIHPPSALREAIGQQRMRLAAIELPSGATPTERAPLEHAIKLAFLRGFRVVTLIAAALALISGLCAAVWLRPATTSR
ncbi:MAG TPA: MFS transporter [Polyangiaceae bacterium]